MKKSHRDLLSLIQSLPQPLYSECRSALLRPIVALKRRVLYFEGPYSALRLQLDGFDPLVRFILTRAEAGDSLAELARAEMLQRHRTLQLGEPPPAPATDFWGDFFTANKAAWESFHRTIAPECFVDCDVPADAHFQRDPAVDAALTDGVLTGLREFGFRRLARSFQTDIIGEPLLIKWDKGTWSINISLHLRMEHRCLFLPLGEAFSSGACFDFSLAGNVTARMHSFFRTLRFVFPEFLEAIHEGMVAQDAWLAHARKVHPSAQHPA